MGYVWGGEGGQGGRLGSPSHLAERGKARVKLGHLNAGRLPDPRQEPGINGKLVLPWSTAQSMWLQWGFAELGQRLAVAFGV